MSPDYSVEITHRILFIVGVEVNVERFDKVSYRPKYCERTGVRLNDERVAKGMFKIHNFKAIPEPDYSYHFLNHLTIPELKELRFYPDGNVIGDVVWYSSSYEKETSFILETPKISPRKFRDIDAKLKEIGINKKAKLYVYSQF